jgi:hypothetical protein
MWSGWHQVVNKEEAAAVDQNALYYALSTIAQCAAALAALIGFLGLWRLDRLREEQRLIVHTESDLRQKGHTPDPIAESLSTRSDTLSTQQWWLMLVLSVFLAVTLVGILTPALLGFIFFKELLAWAWTPWLLGVASTWLGVAPAYLVISIAWKAMSRRHAPVVWALLLALATPALAGTVRCTTYEEKSVRHEAQ